MKLKDVMILSLWSLDENLAGFAVGRTDDVESSLRAGEAGAHEVVECGAFSL